MTRPKAMSKEATMRTPEHEVRTIRVEFEFTITAGSAAAEVADSVFDLLATTEDDVPFESVDAWDIAYDEP